LLRGRRKWKYGYPDKFLQVFPDILVAKHYIEAGEDHWLEHDAYFLTDLCLHNLDTNPYYWSLSFPDLSKKCPEQDLKDWNHLVYALADFGMCNLYSYY